MSTDETNPVSQENSLLPALDQHPQAAAALPSAVSWVHAGRGEPDAANASSAYLHALRRHWVAAVVLGLVCGAAAATVVVLVRRPVYAAIALLRVAVSANVMVYGMPETRAEAGTTLFDIYRTRSRSKSRAATFFRRPCATVKSPPCPASGSTNPTPPLGLPAR